MFVCRACVRVCVCVHLSVCVCVCVCVPVRARASHTYQRQCVRIYIVFRGCLLELVKRRSKRTRNVSAQHIVSPGPPSPVCKLYLALHVDFSSVEAGHHDY